MPFNSRRKSIMNLMRSLYFVLSFRFSKFFQNLDWHPETGHWERWKRHCQAAKAKGTAWEENDESARDCQIADYQLAQKRDEAKLHKFGSVLSWVCVIIFRVSWTMREKITDKISKRDKLSERIKNALLACFNAIGPVWNFLFVKTPDPDALHADEIWHDCYVLRHNFSCLASRLASQKRKTVLE